MNEKVFKVMNVVGGGSIAMGVILIVVGVAVGILSIVSGAKLLREKKNIIF